MSEIRSDEAKSNSSAEPTKSTQPNATVDGGYTQGKGAYRSSPQENTENEILDRVKAGERWMICLTAIVAATAIFQTVQSCNNNKSTTQQTGQLIAAAKISAYASNQNAQAARNFADSARSINSGIGDAVDKLKLQAGLAKESVEVAQHSLLVTAHSERAWVGLADARLLSFAPDEPLEFEIDLDNTGKSPALNVRTAMYDVWLKSTRSEASKQQEIAKARKLFEFKPGESISPGQTYKIKWSSFIGGVNGGLTSTGVQEIITGRVALYFPGRLEFVDIYQRHQWVDFCMYITGVSGRAEILACPLPGSNQMSYQRETD